MISSLLGGPFAVDLLEISRIYFFQIKKSTLEHYLIRVFHLMEEGRLFSVCKNCFKRNLRTINYDIATHEGNVARRFSSVALKILLLHDGILKRELQKKLDTIKKCIFDGLNFYNENGQLKIRISGLKRANAKKYIGLLQDFEHSFEEVPVDHIAE